MKLPMMQPNQRTNKTLALLVAMASLSSSVLSMDLFQVKLIENDNSRLIATSNYNYALASPKLLAKGWQTISVNGDQVHVTLVSNGQDQLLSRAQLAPADLAFVEQLRDEIAHSNNGYHHISTMGGSATSSSSSSSNSIGGNNIIMGSSSFQSSGGNNLNMRDDDNFSVSRSDLPYDWSSVFFNGITVTFVTKLGEVRMQPMGTLTPEQQAAVNQIKSQALEMSRSKAQEMSRTMQQSMDTMSNMFNDMTGRLPTPPNYQSSVGNMFGNNWPFGPNNNPFSAPGWPFNGGRGGGGGGGAMAFADAGRR